MPPPSSCAHLQRNPKSYSAWFQRKWIIDRGLGDFNKEIALCDQLLNFDERNFHCWNYRRHVCKLAGVSREDQFAFTTKKIEPNFSNYSALHHRSITLLDPLMVDVLLDEISMVQQAVFADPDDKSAWFYYHWLVTSMLTLLQCSAPDAATFLTSQWVVVTLADVHDRMGEMTEVDGWQESKKQIIALYERAITLDHDHCRYYENRIKKQSN
ncbi:hypothetical protein PsorP6_017601 [Peronosclerospora sorghi]|uniref:Uncharacterized protein n=1 Tax=Peronosclerospora sorghi TaxID=230839 RepID=A0ACC0WKT9_9STRA|nr:hypothetical protein PsorP6_017601 [Peronosclerospora sorghi]